MFRGFGFVSRHHTAAAGVLSGLGLVRSVLFKVYNYFLPCMVAINTSC